MTGSMTAVVHLAAIFYDENTFHVLDFFISYHFILIHASLASDIICCAEATLLNHKSPPLMLTLDENARFTLTVLKLGIQGSSM